MFTLNTAWLLTVSFFLFAYFQFSRYIVDSWVAKSVSSDQWFSNIRSVSRLQLKLLWILYKGSGFSHLVGLAWIPGSLLFYYVRFKSIRLIWWSAMVFPIVMYGCESWTIKKAEPRRIDAFELWCWRRLLRVPWTARRSNQSILKEINPEYWKDWYWSSDNLATWCEEPTH